MAINQDPYQSIIVNTEGNYGSSRPQLFLPEIASSGTDITVYYNLYHEIKYPTKKTYAIGKILMFFITWR